MRSSDEREIPREVLASERRMAREAEDQRREAERGRVEEERRNVGENDRVAAEERREAAESERGLFGPQVLAERANLRARVQALEEEVRRMRES